MKKLTIALLLFTLSALTSWAGDFQKGMSAYVSGDYTTAFKEFAASAEQGNVDAQFNLALMYKNGQGVPQDYKQAVKWYTKAAEQGNANAQYSLGYRYANGQGVPQDNVYAHMWFNLAAANGDEDASKNRDIIAKRMTTADISKAQSLARECLKKNYKGC
ncbi:sel1 repeat family protein [Burkholderiaceae bacterium]|nr:sel1 repeat family protein [Burkholderiaceae bacterium]